MAVLPKAPTLWRKVHNLWISELYHAIKPQVKGRLSLGIDEDVRLIELDDPVSRVLPDLGHLFSGTAALPEPYPGRGMDPAPDGLPCRAP